MNALARFNCGVLAVSLLIAGVVCAPICDAAPKDKPPKTTENSDLNQDNRLKLLTGAPSILAPARKTNFTADLRITTPSISANCLNS
jgi:hypothetical protein